MKEIVKGHVSKNENGEVRVNLESLSKDGNFRNAVVNAIVKKVKASSHACVLFPSYKPCLNTPLGKIINELAQTLVVETLVTGDINRIRDIRGAINEVIIIKQSFKSGVGLQKQIKDVREMGYKVSVISLIAHSGAALERFKHANGVSLDALVCLDEISYLS